MARLGLPLLLAGAGAVALALSSKKRGGQRPETKPDAQELGFTFEGGTPVVPAIPWEGEAAGATRVPAELEEINVTRVLLALPTGVSLDYGKGWWPHAKPVTRRVVIASFPKDRFAKAIVRACLSASIDRGSRYAEWMAPDVANPSHTGIFARVVKRAWPRSWTATINDRGEVAIDDEVPGRRPTPCPAGFDQYRGGWPVSEFGEHPSGTIGGPGSMQLVAESGALVLEVVVSSAIFYGDAIEEIAQSYTLQVEGVVTWMA